MAPNKDREAKYDFDTHTHLNISVFEGEEKESSRVQRGTSRDALRWSGRYGHDTRNGA